MNQQKVPTNLEGYSKAIGLFVLGAVVGLLGLSMLFVPRSGYWPFSGLHLLTYAWDAFSFATFGASFLIMRRGKKYLAPSADTLRRRDSRQPVLLLRSFGDDELPALSKGITLSPGGSRKTFEEHLVDGLKRYGPVVSLGPPGEELPPLGAAREYVVDDSWRDTIRELVDESRLIATIAGTTDNLIWELQTIIERGAIEKLLIFFPQLETSGPAIEMNRARWALTRDTLAKVGVESLPDDEIVFESGIILAFPKGEPRLFTGKRIQTDSYLTAIKKVASLLLD